MEIMRQIDQLISSLTELKPYIADKSSETNNKFTDELNTSIEKLSAIANVSFSPQANLNTSAADIPSWVDKKY